MFKRISDKEIIEGIRSQDNIVLNWLYDNYFQTVKNYVLKNSGSDEDVSDLFQDAIIALYKQVSESKFTLTTDLKGYFFGITRTLWSAQLRYKKRIEELNLDIVEESEPDESSDLILERVVSRAFGKIKPDCREVLTLYSEGLSYEEIAVKMKLKNETYARRKKYLCKEAIIELIKEDPEYRNHLNFLK